MLVDTLYDTVASAFAVRIEEAFSSEETLKRLWDRHLPGLPFDRTERWSTILARELEWTWKEYGPVVKSPMTGADRLDLVALLADKLDYNIFSQVLLNLQNWGLLSYRLRTAEEDKRALARKWEGKVPSPLTHPKMFKEVSSPEQASFNHDLSVLKSLHIIAKAGPHVSFRVSPKGSTPALADSSNLSMLGVGSDRYLALPPGVVPYYLTWDSSPLTLDLRADGKFYDAPLPYGFTSKTGGDILHAVLAARQLMVSCYHHISPDCQKVFLPRMASLMIMTNEDPDLIRAFVQAVQKGDAALGPWRVTLHEGER